MNYLEPARAGLIKALRTTLYLTRIIVPVTLIVTALEKLALLQPLAAFFQPPLKLLGLPGEAALALVLGFFINIYAAIGALSVLDLLPREITVIAVIILTSHSLLLESPVLHFTGLSLGRSILLRITVAFLFGLTVHLVYTIVGG